MTKAMAKAATKATKTVTKAHPASWLVSGSHVGFPIRVARRTQSRARMVPPHMVPPCMVPPCMGRATVPQYGGPNKTKKSTRLTPQTRVRLCWHGLCYTITARVCRTHPSSRV